MHYGKFTLVSTVFVVMLLAPGMTHAMARNVSNCQQTASKALSKFVSGSLKELNRCFERIDRDHIGNQVGTYTNSAPTCVKAMAKFIDSSRPDKTLEAKLTASVSIKCDSTYPNTKAYPGMDSDISGSSPELSVNIEAQFLGTFCTNLGVPGELGAQNWLSCMTAAGKRAVASSLMVSHPKAVVLINGLTNHLESAPDSAEQSNIDARAALDEWKNEICSIQPIFGC